MQPDSSPGPGKFYDPRFFWHKIQPRRHSLAVKKSSVILIPSAIALGLASCKPEESKTPAAPEPAKESTAEAPKPAAIPAKPVQPSAVVPAASGDPNAPSLIAGSEVRVESLANAQWIQGGPLTAFEPGKIYLFECWATWCGPCVAAIPHLNDLHKRYADKGLRVFGINVWEDGLEKVTEFVKRKNEGMSYPVAYTGKDSPFEKEWLKPAGVSGIPRAFVVRDGKLLMTAHPMQLTESLIESLLSGDDGARQAIEKIQAENSSREKLGAIMKTFRTATLSGDAAVMTEKIAELEKIDPESPYLASMKLDLLIASKDWTAAAKSLETMPEGPGRQMSLQMTANKVCLHEGSDYPLEFVKTLSSAYAAQLAGEDAMISPMSFVTLSTLQWKSGEKEASLASAKKAVETASNTKSKRPLPAEPFERFAKGVEEGKVPTLTEVSRWIRETMEKNAPNPPARPMPVPLTPLAPAKP